MGVDHVKRITIRKSGVYVFARYSDFNLPYENVRDRMLSRAYQSGGQRELDRVFIKLLFDGSTEIAGTAPSVTRFLPCLEKGEELYNDTIAEINQEFGKLFMAGKIETLGLPTEQQTEEVKAYHKFEQNAMAALDAKLLELVEPAPEQSRQTELPR